MVKSAGHFDEFEPHTRLKHLILRTYFQTWARKLLLRPGAGDTVLFIDACAGRGMDDVGNDGSPIIAAKEAAIAEAQVSRTRGVQVHVPTVAIEKSAGHFRALQAALAPFGRGARALRGTLVEFLPELLAEIGSAPILCFIDPFGIEPLRAQVVSKVLGRPHSEVFVLLADQACLRHFGAAAAVDDGNEVSEPNLFTSSGLEVIEFEITPESDGARQITAERAREILDSAFGDSGWYHRIMNTPRTARRSEFLRMYVEFLHASGAQYVLSIPVRNDENKHVYHLVHATHSKTGHIAMKDAVSHALNHADLSNAVTRTMKFSIRTNLHAVVARILDEFAGEMMLWRTSNDKGKPALRSFVLADTAAYPHEMPELKTLLRKYRVKGTKALVYRFPEKQLG